jgi:hypothetical protein
MAFENLIDGAGGRGQPGGQTELALPHGETPGQVGA